MGLRLVAGLLGRRYRFFGRAAGQDCCGGAAAHGLREGGTEWWDWRARRRFDEGAAGRGRRRAGEKVEGGRVGLCQGS